MPEPRRALLLGGSGQLGSAIRRLWTGAQITAPTHDATEITDVRAVAAAIEASGAQAVINCAAFHNVERCETDPQSAFGANALAVSAMAEQCAQREIAFVTFSTDYVFDGEIGRPYTEADAPAPMSVYGISKYAGELLVERLQSNAYVVRTCGVYGTHVSATKGHTFIDRILTQARAGESLRVVRDQTVSPTYAAHLAQGVLDLLRSDAAPGLYHIANEGAVTWYDYAVEALRQAGIDGAIEPISYKDWNSRVRRPAYSALDNAKSRALGVRMPDWRAGIAAYLHDRISR